MALSAGETRALRHSSARAAWTRFIAGATKLKRDVALKVLPDPFAERLAIEALAVDGPDDGRHSLYRFLAFAPRGSRLETGRGASRIRRHANPRYR